MPNLLTGCDSPKKGSDAATPACDPIKEDCPFAKCDATVTIGHVQRGNPYVSKNASAADGMPDSVPPGKTYEVQVTVTWSKPSCPGQFIDLSIINGSGDNGTATVTPTRITATATVVVKGGSQTKPGNGGHLQLQAKLDGTTIKATSLGFTVCAHPLNYRDTFAGDINGQGVGVAVSDDWDSDSGSFADLNEAEDSEVVAVVQSDSPPWDAMGAGTGQNSGYGPANARTQDSHSWGRPPAGPAGKKVFTQLCLFKCHRCGAVDKIHPNSGFKIIHEVFKDGAQWKHRAKKVGAAVTIGVNTTQSGSANVTSLDHNLP